MKNSEQTFYQVLEIAQNAPHQEVVKAYHRAKEAYAADSPALYTMFTKEEANELRNLIEEAFQILGNQTKRRDYDQRLLNRGPQQGGVGPIEVRQAKLAETSNYKATELPNKSALAYTVDTEFEREIVAQSLFDGAFLKKVRLYKKLSIEHLSKETRVSRSYLNAIEADDFASLPAPVFLRGFVMQFAKHLGLDQNVVSVSYMSRIKKEV